MEKYFIDENTARITGRARGLIGRVKIEYVALIAACGGVGRGRVVNPTWNCRALPHLCSLW